MHAVLTALSDFARAGLHPRTPLARGLVAALLIKVCVVVAMRLFLFGDADRVAIDQSLMDRHLLPAASQSEGF